jgi:hypothetical protein
MNAVHVKHNSALRAILVLVFAISPGTDFLLKHVAEPCSSQSQRRDDIAAISTAYHIVSGVLSNAIVPQLATDRPGLRIWLNGTSCLASSLLAQQTPWTRAELSVIPDGLAFEVTALPGFWFHAKLCESRPENASARLASN